MSTQNNQEVKEISTDSIVSPEETNKAENYNKSVRLKLINGSLIVTVLALALSVFQVWQSRQSERVIKGIAEAVSTQYIDKFPKNIPSINKLLDETTSSLLIVTDFPAYGNFYQHKSFEEYRLKLQGLTLSDKKINIKLLTYNRSIRQLKLEKHFANKPIEDLWKEGFFRDLDKEHKPQTHADAYRMVEEGNEKFLNELFERNVEIKQTANDLPVFVWIRDDKEAIFSFYFYGESPQEVSFRTIDRNLIKVLNDIATVAFDAGSKYTPELKP